MEPPQKRARQASAECVEESKQHHEAIKLPDITGLWAVHDPDDCYRLYRLRQAPNGQSFEGVEIGAGAISNGKMLPYGRVEWSSRGRRWVGQLDPTSWCIRDGSYHCETSGKSLGTFSAIRQREVSPEDVSGEDLEEDGEGREFKDWADGLFFSLDRDGREQLLDVDGIQVMMEWEKPYMEKCADELQVTPDCDVLEVGFGCGYSASRIQLARPRSHTIIECSEVVLERLRAWAANRPGVRVVDGTWQKRLPELGTFDKIFFDDYGQPGQSDQEMSANCPDERYKTVYEESQSHFHGFLNIVLQWHSRPNTRISGYLVHPIDFHRCDVDVNFQPYGVSPPPHCDYFFSNTAMVPIFSKVCKSSEDFFRGEGSESTRSRSRSQSSEHSDSKYSHHEDDVDSSASNL